MRHSASMSYAAYQIKKNQIKKSFIASCLHNFWAKVHILPKEIEHLKYYTVL